jgi:hypothetical protein
MKGQFNNVPSEFILRAPYVYADSYQVYSVILG